MVQFGYLRLLLSFETVSCRLLQRMGRMDMDWNTLKNWAYFVKFYAESAKITKKLLRLVLPNDLIDLKQQLIPVM